MSPKNISSSSLVAGSETCSESVPSTAIPLPENIEGKLTEHEISKDEIPTENVCNYKLAADGDDLQVVPSTSTTSDATKDEEDFSSSNKSDEKPPSDDEASIQDESSKVPSLLKRTSITSSTVSISETGSPPSTVFPSRKLVILKRSPSLHFSSNALVEEAWEHLKKTTMAALDPSVEALNYNQVFVRDFSSSSLNKSDEKPPSDDRREKPKKSVTIQNSDEVTSTTKEDDQSSKVPALLKPSPSIHVMESLHQEISPNPTSNSDNSSGNALVEEAWENLKKSVVLYKGIPVGTLAALDPSVEALNYNQVFVRDFVPSGLAYMMQSKPEVQIVKNFLLKTLHLQSWEKRVDNFTLGEGVMPASFKVLLDDSCQGRDTLKADFGGSAIGRVAPVDSGFWWIIMLRSYTKCSQDYALSEMPEMQRGMRLILNLCLSDGFDTFPTLLCADGCSMIDRRMGVYGYPIEIQALFFFALRCARQMLKPERGGKELLERIDKRIVALRYHIQTYFWLDHTQLNNIYRYKTEEYSHTAVNKFNVIPDSIPEWVFDFMPLRGGYFIGNVSPARIDFRWFLIGNCIAILSSLATPEQETAIMDLFEERWEDLIGEMPLKIAYPALEGSKWRIVTGCDTKNRSWSYHNGGSWPVLIWLFTAACIKSGRPQIAKKAIELAEKRLSKDGWPEYYDGKTGRYIGKQARKLQTWTISGYLVAKQMIENPANVFLISLEEDNQEAEQSFEALNLDVITNILEKLICRLNQENFFAILQNVVETHEVFESLLQSGHMIEFVIQMVFKETGKWERENWDSLHARHQNYLNFRDGVYLYSRLTSRGSICKAIRISGDSIICGFKNGKVMRFEIMQGKLNWVSTTPPLQREKIHVVAYSIVGLVFVSEFEVVFGCMDGCICSMKISEKNSLLHDTISLVHSGLPVEGTLICFEGNEYGFVGLYSGQPSGQPKPSIRVWNKERQIIYTGELLGLQDGLEIQHGLGKLNLSGNIALVCTSGHIISFDMEHPEKGVVLQKEAQEGTEFIIRTFTCNTEFCCVVRKDTHYLEKLRIKDLELVEKSKLTHKYGEYREPGRYVICNPIIGAMHGVFNALAYSTNITSLPGKNSKELEPIGWNVTSVDMDYKCLVSATDVGWIHMWYFGP